MREMACACARQTVGDLIRLLIMTVYRTTMPAPKEPRTAQGALVRATESITRSLPNTTWARAVRCPAAVTQPLQTTRNSGA